MGKWNVRIQWDASQGPIACRASMRTVTVTRCAPAAAVRDARSFYSILYGLQRECLQALLDAGLGGATVWVPGGGQARGYGSLVFREAVERSDWEGGRYLLGCLIPQGAMLPVDWEVEL